MKYLPVDYTLSGFHTVGIWVTVIGTLTGILAIVAGIYYFGKNKKTAQAIWASVGGLALIALALIPQFTDPNPYSQPAYSARFAQTPEIQRTIEEAYGLKITPSQIRSLSYPMLKPTKDFEVFGSFTDRKQTEGANFESRKVYLVWADGKLNLSQSTDGESFTELKSKD